ncbi:hypothetical protein PVL29_026599 [Vitis rotundifolia]|uniref:ABC transporter domain-containing protein n=1 Tax=Vitis rotundifolia TaxID=103349 RepID=A0AA38YGQ4_VITRO|nr:hypothetical protein PVL29_026599 [Vitis rotundifolia]
MPRWTPSPSPPRSPSTDTMKNDRVDMGSIGSEEDMSSSTENFFPFSTAIVSASPPPHSDIHRSPSLGIHSSFEKSLEVDAVGQQKGEGNFVTRIDISSMAKPNGVFLTWKDLWVTVPDGKNGLRAILQGLTGYAQPGEVLAIMGPSGCGQSTLLDALAGRLGSNTWQVGDILINGGKQRLAFGTSLQLPDSMSRSEKRERAEMTIREMGLQDAMNTRIGGWIVKGLSGGQKRRVSICIEILTRPKLLFLDEPTSGLDSAASFHVMSRIVKLAYHDGITVIASIHQPSSEVFELFHNLCLLSSGKTVYFGSASNFFGSSGFPWPPLRNPSDHYLRTINKDFDAGIEQGPGERMSTEEAINLLVRSYKSSETCLQVQGRVSEICQQKVNSDRSLFLWKGVMLENRGSHASFITQCLVLTRRSFVSMYRDLGYYWLRLAIYIALCLCVGTIFYDIGSSYGSIQARGSMLMFVAAFLTFLAIGGFPSFVEDMKIFGRERLNGHYGVASFVVGNTFSSIPYLLMISLIPGAIACYLVDLHDGLEHFIFFALTLFVCVMLVESLMMIVASAGIQGVMMPCGGFFRLPNDLPEAFWKYPMYCIAFHKFASQGFYKNEFEGLTFPNNEAGGPPTTSGEEILRNIWQLEMGNSKWVDLAILFGTAVLYRLLFLGIIKTVEEVTPMIKALLAVPPQNSMQIAGTPHRSTPLHEAKPRLSHFLFVMFWS